MLLDSMTEGVSLSAEDGTILYTNPAEDRMFGYARGELLGQHVSIQNGYPPEENARIVEEVIAELKLSGAWRGEWLNRRKDGATFITTSRISAVDIEGRPHWLCVQEDVTEQKHAAAALRASEARLELATEAASLGIWDWDVSTDQMTYSPRAREICGFTPHQEVTYADARAVTHPDDYPRTSAMAQRALDPAIRERQPYEYRVVRPDGTIRCVLANGEAVFAEVDGEVRAVRYVGTLQDITERKQAEEALHESAARLRASEAKLAKVLDEVPVGVGLFDIEGRFTLKNPRLRGMIGDLIPSRDEVDGGRWEAFDVAGRPVERQDYPGARVLRGEDSPPSVDFRSVDDDGERWLRVSAASVRNESGPVTGGITVIQDVTDQLRIQNELKQLNSSLEERVAQRTAERDRVWRNSRDLLVIIDRRWNLVAINPAATTLLGYAIEEAVGRRFSDFVHPDDLQTAAQSIRAAASAPVGDFEARLRAKDGSWRWFSWSAAPGEGEAYVSGRDITAEKERQKQLAAVEAARRDADALYRAYFENTPEALFVIGVEPDGAFVVEEVNHAHEAGVGLKIEDIRGKRIEEILPPTVAGQVLKTYREVVETGAILQYREVFDLTGEPQHWDTSIVPVRDADGRITRLIGSSRNVTRQVVAEEALRQSQKMESMGQLTGGVAHDFNNLLSPIIGGLDLLQRRGVGDERAQRTIAGALASAERAKTLVQRLLAFARRQPLQATAVDARAVVRGMADLLSSTTGPQVKVHVEVPEELPPAIADANQVEMALLNLSVNARDAMPDGGTLTISASEDLIGPGHRSKLSRGRYILLSVSDTGVGMDETTLTRAVEPFFSTKGIGKGTGLGLSMVHGLAAQLGGAMHMASHVGLGTKVELWLPIANEAVQDRAPISDPKVLAASGVVLLVDDEELVRASTADMLGDMGYAVVEAESAESALRLLGEGMQPDLLVTDHLMPGMNGTDLAREVRDRLPGTPVLVISGYAEAEGIAADLPRLTKPFRQADLAASVAETMGRSD